MHELEFCGDVKSWCDALFAAHPEWPFSHAKIEQYGKGNNKRQDLRIYRKDNATPVLCGEVKMPGTPEGRSPYDPALMQDAFGKADNVQCPYFFTWNVNSFVLFDRGKWHVPMIDRRMRDWNLDLRLTSPGACRRPDVQSAVRERFLPTFFKLFAAILTERRTDWGVPPDVLFIHSLESHLEWPVIGTADYMGATCQSDSLFKAKLQAWMAGEMGWTFDPDHPDDWAQTLDRAARTLVYVFCNRAIFYDAIRARFPDTLRPLALPRKSQHGHEGVYQNFRTQFQQAIYETGDYEPIFYPAVDDWAGALVFASPMACQGWLGVFTNLSQYNFKDIPSDVLGGIFQRLIAPEERQKFGQFYTNEDIVDIMNAFCIRKADDVVIDPACGSGSFLVRAYHRKSWLSEQQSARSRSRDAHLSHQDLLRGIFGCDIALFAAHLATLNLAARQINDEENYPYIARGNFFEVIEDREAFCRVPGGLREKDGSRKAKPVPLPAVDAVLGNPPYVRQEGIDKRTELKRRTEESKVAFEARRKNTKEHFQELCNRLWPDIKLTGRSDLHCYFWPVAASALNEGGHFGFLTSSSWLDVEYGFALQRWILKNFKIVAIAESLDEPWFQDARVKTAITILERCSDDEARADNVVRFVRFFKPVSVILGERPPRDESARQNAAEELRKRILATRPPKPAEPMTQWSDATMRIITVRQSDLWQEGVKAWELLQKQNIAALDTDEEEAARVFETAVNYLASGPDYAAGKWGRFLRAPDIYFRLLENYAGHFVRLGEIAEIKFGIKSGCDAFFMPHDVTEEVLKKVADGLSWLNVGLMTNCKFKEIQNGKVRIIRAGDNTLHPIERVYIRPEVHTLMQVSCPVIRASECPRVVLWVNQELKDIAGTYAAKYIRWGAKQTFASKKSKAVRVPERSTVAARSMWYNITSDRIGVSFWPKTQQYRHIIPANPEGIVCNCNLYTLIPNSASSLERRALAALLNSTVVALMKCFFGRYAGTEGALKTEVVDTVLLEVPDPRGISAKLVEKMERAIAEMSKRKVTQLVEDRLMKCHSVEHMREILETPSELPEELRCEDRKELDDAVLELIGITQPDERQKFLGELYRQTSDYYRHQRTLEIQGARNRSVNSREQIGPPDLAGSIWDSLSDKEKGVPVQAWINTHFSGRVPVEIPDGKAVAVGAQDFFDSAAVNFRQGATTVQKSYANAAQAALVAELAGHEIRGSVELPAEAEACVRCLTQLQGELKAVEARFRLLAGSRTGQVPMQDKVTMILMHWFIQGKA